MYVIDLTAQGHKGVSCVFRFFDCFRNTLENYLDWVFGVNQKQSNCENDREDTVFLREKPPLAQLRSKNHDLPL